MFPVLPTLIPEKYNYWEAYFMNEHGNILVLFFSWKDLITSQYVTQTTEITTANEIKLHPSLALWTFNYRILL